MTVSNDQLKLEQFQGPLAFLADIHGNLAALDAVIAAARADGASTFFVAGDLVYRGDKPLEVWKRLVEIGARCTRGTSDVALIAVDPDKLRPTDPEQRSAVEKFRWTRTALGELILERIRRLPDILRVELRNGDEIALTYGSPLDPTIPITHDLDDDEIAALIGDDPADIVVSGGADVPFEREVGGVRVIGLGSTGEAPGTADERVAHYALIEPGPEGLAVALRWVTY